MTLVVLLHTWIYFRFSFFSSVLLIFVNMTLWLLQYPLLG